jgi:hypothetical protein
VWTSSAYYKLVAGSLSNIGSFVMTTTGRDQSATYLSQRQCDLSGITGTLSRVACTLTLTDSATRYVTGSIFGFGLTAGMPVDITLRVAGAQLERGDGLAGATSYIPTSGAAVTRMPDIYQQF